MTKECFADLARIYNSPEDRLQQVKGNLNYQTEMTKSRKTFETILFNNMENRYGFKITIKCIAVQSNVT